jgi:hypothetical protein
MRVKGSSGSERTEGEWPGGVEVRRRRTAGGVQWSRRLAIADKGQPQRDDITWAKEQGMDEGLEGKTPGAYEHVSGCHAVVVHIS